MKSRGKLIFLLLIISFTDVIAQPSPQSGYQARILVEEFVTERDYDIFRLFADSELLLE